MMHSYVLTPGILDKEHICCAISDKKCSAGYLAKKEWLINAMAGGHVFRKYDLRGKVFIEYCPAEEAWAPVEAPGYTFINCFWVSGQYKGKGFGKQLLLDCIADAKGTKGIAVITGSKKMPFLSDSKFFSQQGFTRCHTAPPYFELWYLPLQSDAAVPSFRSCVREAVHGKTDGLTLYYSNACPFTDYYVNTELVKAAKDMQIPLEIIKITTKEEAQNHMVPFTIYSLFYKGEFLTHQILSCAAFKKLMSKVL